MKRTASALVLLPAAFLLAACTAASSTEPALSSFASVDEAYDAVAATLDCDPATTAEPVTVEIDGYLPQYRMCTETVEIIRYDNEADRMEATELIEGAENGPGYFAEGNNWHVLVLPGRDGTVPGSNEVSELADAMGGRFVTNGGTE
ncbi:hypothetical protein MUK71_09780 [Arthrobacter zhangbolii]|uniref:Lipoprotein n=1 Tax=Arthrobacter zhangbolii TaxID=2886936 RepID=A0A9X1S8G2_9MICC|nr:hypothetical protein [Arthrobacter zhangbolii]MCC3271287.1 hypothetical protein [Arthrobacter zhangbolii]UON90928.1 hypothetical protein MUK71_09780 [Arthrobacter zhangbolii]